MKHDKGGLWRVVVCALGVAAGAIGCGGAPPEETSGTTTVSNADLLASVCDQICDCKGTCSDSEMADCVKGGEDFQAEASASKCDSRWDDYLSCLDQHIACEANNPLPGQCSPMLKDLDLCISAAKPPCDDPRTDIMAAFEECGATPPEVPATCSASTKRRSRVRPRASWPLTSCDAITGVDAAGKKEIDDCMAACLPS